MSVTAPRRRSWLWLQGLVCGAALSLATAPVILLAVLLAPGLVAFGIDQRLGKPAATAMLLLGLAASFTPLRIMWESGHTMTASLEVITDPARTGLAWLCAGAGWLMEETAHIIAIQYSALEARRRIAALRAERALLVEEWGPIGSVPPPHP